MEHLRVMRADLCEVKERLNRVELRLSAMEQTLGSLYALSGSDRETLQGLTRRVERIERRLELTEQGRGMWWSKRPRAMLIRVNETDLAKYCQGST